jgi:hypothetical protein
MLYDGTSLTPYLACDMPLCRKYVGISTKK